MIVPTPLTPFAHSAATLTLAPFAYVLTSLGIELLRIRKSDRP